jgi:hypothetical protein
MKDIYSTATEVLGWLGHEHELLGDLVWASTVFRDAVENKYGKLTLDGTGTRPRSDLNILYTPSFWQGISLDGSPTRLEQATKFTAICQWFNRSWIVQEVCLAKEIKLLCGSAWIPWDGLFWLGAMFSTPWGQISQVPRMPRWMHQIPTLGYRVWEYHFVRARVAQPVATEATTTAMTISHFLTHLLNHIRLFRETKCSDGRDKVYSLLGLVKVQYDKANQIPDDFIPVDYEMYTTEDVFRQLACLCLQHLDSLHLLSSVEDRGVGTNPTLPSWIPDFTQPYGCHPLFNGHQKPFCVWGQRGLPTWKPEIRGNELNLWGVQIDTVDIAIRGSMYRSQGHNGGLVSLEPLQMCLPDIQREPSYSRVATLMWMSMMRDPSQPNESFPAYTEAAKAYRSTLHAEIATELHHSAIESPEAEEANIQQLKEVLQHFQHEIEVGELPTLESIMESVAWLSTLDNTTTSLDARRSALLNLSNLTANTMRYVHFAHRPCKGRKGFRTVSGRLGLGPPSTAPGDEIWMLHGGDLPVVLRPYDDWNPSPPVGMRPYAGWNESTRGKYSSSFSEDYGTADRQSDQDPRSPSIVGEDAKEDLGSTTGQYSPSVSEHDETAIRARRSPSIFGEGGNGDSESFQKQKDPIITGDDKFKNDISGSGFSIGRYHLVGECYLHQYMYGKMLEEDEKLEEKLVPLILR